MDNLNSLILASAAAVAAALFGVVLSSIANRVSLFLMWLAARILPTRERERYREAWAAEICEIKSGPQKVFFALQLFLASPRIRHAIKSTSREASPSDVAELRIPRWLILGVLTGLLIGLSAGLIIIALSSSKVEMASWVTAAVSAASITAALAYGSYSFSRGKHQKERGRNGKGE
ncbi:MAG: hypothetical protein HOY79_51245 [Streptomyces sp.]|nr:hypothetical protein [Streptomyces sp.]